MDRTVLVGLDGATFSILDPLIDAGVMPFLGDLMRQGVRGDLHSTLPYVSPTAWTTCMTGCLPGRHGIFDFVRAVEREGEMYFTLYDARDIRCETVWSMVSRQNKRVIALNFMVTFPPPPISGYLIPGFVTWKHLKGGVRPPELYERIKTLPGLSYKEMAWDFELEKKVLQGVERQEYEPWARFHIHRERQWYEIVRHLMETDPCDLTAVVFDGVDKLQHICWRFLDPACVPSSPSAWEKGIIDLCLEYFRRLDGYLAQIVRLAGPEARIFVVSDHGFGPQKEVFRVNMWLHEQQYVTWRTPETLDEVSRRSLERRLNSNFAHLDWQKTQVYARTSSNNGLYIRQAPGPGQPGVLPQEYEALRQRLIDSLVHVVSPATGERIVKQVWTREAAFPEDQMQEAPDLMLELKDHGFATIANTPPAIAVLPEVIGTHQPDGIFLAAGPGIHQGRHTTPLSIADITPLLLYSLGLEIPAGLDGRVPVEVFRPAWVQANPIRIDESGRSSVGTGATDRTPGAETDEETLVAERLRALNYL